MKDCKVNSFIFLMARGSHEVEVTIYVIQNAVCDFQTQSVLLNRSGLQSDYSDPIQARICCKNVIH